MILGVGDKKAFTRSQCNSFRSIELGGSRRGTVAGEPGLARPRDVMQSAGSQIHSPYTVAFAQRDPQVISVDA